MPTLGEELKRRREERGITLNDISESTRIGTRFLKAIETDNFSILPGGIFTRSFIRAYAKEVGMNEDEAIGLYQQQISGDTGQLSAPAQSQQPSTVETRAPKPRAVEKPQAVEKTYPVEKPQRRAEPLTYRQTSPPMNWSSLIIAGGIVIFIVIVVIALVKTLNKSSEETPQPQATAAANQNAPPPPTANTNQDQTTPPQPMAGPLTVKIEAIKGSWVQYKADNEKPKSQIMKTGQVEEVAAQTQVKIDYGTLSTLKITVNNREMPLPEDASSKDGHLLITSSGIQAIK